MSPETSSRLLELGELFQVHYPRKTLDSCLSEECLLYINAVGEEEEQRENCAFHSALMLGQLRAIFETDIYHQSFPWKVVLALDAKRWDELLKEMKDTWRFVRTVCDPLREKEPLAVAMSFTRFQPFRDVMTKAEYFDLKE